MGHPTVYPTGVTLYDPEKAYNGYTVMPVKGQGAMLIDMNGQEIKLWKGVHGFPNKIFPGGYLLGNALSGSDVANAAQSAADTAAAGAQSAAAAVTGAVQPGTSAPAANLLGYDTANYCKQLAQGDAATQQKCTAAEDAATATLRNCVAMSTGLNGIGSYDALLRCLRAAPAAQPATPAAQ